MSASRRLLPGLLLAFLVSTVLSPSASAQKRPVYNVLTIHSGAVDYAANPTLDGGIRQGLFARAGEDIDYFVEYLEFERFPEVETSRALSDYIRRKYEGRRIDIVIGITNRSLRFALEHRAALFPRAAIVGAAIGLADNELVHRAGGAVTGVVVGSAFAESLKLALRLHPDTKRVFVIATSPNRVNEQTVRDELRPLGRQVPITFLAAETLRDLLTAVRAVPRGSLILYIWYQRSGLDYENTPQEPARLVAAAASVPVYGVIDSNIGTGIVGGMVRDTRKTGLRAGQMARQILDGAPPQSIPIEHAPVLPVFDWRQLQRWGLDPEQLPPGSDVRFKAPTVWEAYGRYILVACLVMTAQLVLIAGLLTQRASRQRAEMTLRAREETLQTSYNRIRRMAGHLINVQEATRAEVARDLHDGVCQELVAISMTVKSLKRSPGAIQDARTQRTLSQIERASLDAVDSVRCLSHDLHPASLRLVGLVAALKAHCLEVEKQREVEVSFETHGDLADIPAEVSVCLFRIAQEALRNGIVHGAARRVEVSVARIDGVIELIVFDDGRGFDLACVQRSASGLGLISIEERAHVVGGTAQIMTLPNCGTTINVRVPVSAHATPQIDDPPERPARVFESAIAQVEKAVQALKRERGRARALVASSRAQPTKNANARMRAHEVADPPRPSTETL